MSNHTFMGMTIEGDITRGAEKQVPQRPKEELAPLLAAVIEDPLVAGVRWRQYTPYFNDGEPCVFGLHGVAVSFVGHENAENDSGDRDGFVEEWDDLYAEMLGGEKYFVATRTFTPLPAKHPELAAKFKELANALEGGAFYEALLELFGDHAVVTVRANQPILVEFYEHD